MESETSFNEETKSFSKSTCIEHPLTNCTQNEHSINLDNNKNQKKINPLNNEVSTNLFTKKLINFKSTFNSNLKRFSEPNLNCKQRSTILNIAPKIDVNKCRFLAVKAENVCHTYGEGEKTNYVLNGVNLNVPKGEIYGLLGPSGCGKTTLLKIICGLLQPEYGTVKLFGYVPGTINSGVPGTGIGYMPQELALQRDLTIGEMLAFYGRICMLDEKTIAKQTEYLINLLEIPCKDCLIGDLSGGQKRRVSLAVTIIHKPRIIILDEPTVGVDPLLCEKIWRLLIDLSVKEKITIIITTHYIEETKRANLVGFMRKGQILVEGNPEKLIEYYNAVGLENVFYKLCLNQKKRKTTIECMHPARRMSIIQKDHNRNLFKKSDTSLDKNQTLQRQGSFTSSFGEYTEQSTKYREKNFQSNYSTPLTSPKFKRSSSLKLNSNSNTNSITNLDTNNKTLKKKKENLHNQYLELKLLDSEIKYKKKPPLEDISSLPIMNEKFKRSYTWNPIISWIWLIIATSYKLILQIMRQPMFLLILYIFPTFCIASLFICIGHTPKNIKVGLILDEKKDHRHRWDNFPEISCNPKDKKVDYDYLFKLYDNLEINNRTRTGDYEHDYFDYIEGIGVYDKLRIPYIPEIILSNVNKNIIDFVNYTNVKDAREDVRNLKIRGYLHFKKEFSRSFIERNMFLKTSSNKNITTEMIDQGTIHMSGDFSDYFMTGSIELTLFEALLETSTILTKKCGLKPNVAKIPIEIKEFIYGEYIKGDYFGVRDFAGPGFMMCITYSLAMGLCTLQTLMELKDQMFVRNFSVGLSASQIIMANLLGRFPYMIGSVTFMFIVSTNLFQIPHYGSFFDAFHILILQTLVGMANGLFFATLIKDLITCLFLSLGFLFFIFFTSGVFWSLESLPYYIKWFSRSLPFTVPNEAFRTILIRKGAPSSYIFPGILMSYVWLMVFIFLSHYSIRKKKLD